MADRTVTLPGIFARGLGRLNAAIQTPPKG